MPRADRIPFLERRALVTVLATLNERDEGFRVTFDFAAGVLILRESAAE